MRTDWPDLAPGCELVFLDRGDLWLRLDHGAVYRLRDDDKIGTQIAAAIQMAAWRDVLDDETLCATDKYSAAHGQYTTWKRIWRECQKKPRE